MLVSSETEFGPAGLHRGRAENTGRLWAASWAGSSSWQARPPGAEWRGCQRHDRSCPTAVGGSSPTGGASCSRGVRPYGRGRRRKTQASCCSPEQYMAVATRSTSTQTPLRPARVARTSSAATTAAPRSVSTVRDKGRGGAGAERGRRRYSARAPRRLRSLFLWRLPLVSRERGWRTVLRLRPLVVTEDGDGVDRWAPGAEA